MTISYITDYYYNARIINMNRIIRVCPSLPEITRIWSQKIQKLFKTEKFLRPLCILCFKNFSSYGSVSQTFLATEPF